MPSAPKTPLPSDFDAPELVRAFLYEVLTSTYNLDETKAQATANEWILGTGSQLRSFPAQAYIDIFGPETGWLLFEETQRRLLERSAGDGDGDEDVEKQDRCARCTRTTKILLTQTLITIFAYVFDFPLVMIYSYLLAILLISTDLLGNPFSWGAVLKILGCATGIIAGMRWADSNVLPGWLQR